MLPWGSTHCQQAHSKAWCMGTQQCQLQRTEGDRVQKGGNVKSLAAVKEMKSQARMDPWNRPAQTLHFAALERLMGYVQGPQCKKLGRPEMEFQFPALAMSAYSTTMVLANSFYFLCQFWLIGGDRLELHFEDSVPCLGLLERSVETKQRRLQ